MVESVESPSPLCRDFVPELLRVVARGGDDAGVTWNVVESLELLLDAGAFKDAGALAVSVVEMLGDDKRNRLFKTYAELCSVVQGAPLREKLGNIEALSIEIEHGGFSANDRCWSAIVHARAIEVGVYTRALPESDLFRARTLLSQEFSKGPANTSPMTHIKVGLELARSYLHCPTPELAAAREILERLTSLSAAAGVSAEVSFDVARLLYQVAGEESLSAEALRAQALPLGGVARGLAEMTIVRKQPVLNESGTSSLEKALALFEESAYRSGEFEALVALGSASAECEHHAKAYRLFSRADKVAHEGGFLYGRGVALLGLFHSAVASSEIENAQIGAEKLRLLCSSEIFLAAFGLNTVAAHQLLGKGDTAKKLATRCEKLFTAQGAHAMTAQAAFMLGASHADSGNWKLARGAWKRALVCDELRRAYISSCDRRAALAQAIAMVDFAEHGDLRENTLVEVERLLNQSEKVLAPFGQSTQALQALGKTLHIHAQLSILAKQPLNALKYLNRARDAFCQLGLEKEVALTDGLTGLALLEASKQSGAQLLDEAVSALQRSLDHFVRAAQPRITWKLRYYLAVALLLRSQQAAEPLHRENYRQMAVGFLEEASIESSLFEVESGMPRASTGEGDFSPGLKPEVLEPLKKVLGMPVKRRSWKKSKDKESPKAPKRYGRYLH
jgi:hypothetical protein